MERQYIYTERSPHVGEFAKALAKAQGVMKNAPRTKRGHHGEYADLATIIDTIRSPLSSNMIAWSQDLYPAGDNHDVLVTELMHASGEWKRSILRIRVNPDPQKYAAHVTYARRLSLSAICGIAADDDDDGHTASQAAAQERVKSDVRAEMMLRKSIDSAKAPTDLTGVMKRVNILLEQGNISQDAADRLKKAADEVAAEKKAAKSKA